MDVSQMSPNEMEQQLQHAVEEHRRFTTDGEVANYIPKLGSANPKTLGITVTMMDGTSFTAGDCDAYFTMQSISKIVSLLLALQDIGPERVFDKVGKEPTGDPFNSIVKLETIKPSRPLNPMINAGAIAVTSMIAGKDNPEKLERLLQLARRLTNDTSVNVNKEVYLSEKSTADRNRALAYFMRENGIIHGDVEDILDLYFRQCAIEVTCSHLAYMGAVLANRGKDPITSEKIVPEDLARIVKTFMVTCGMYNASGAFAIDVGIPAKSGVSGGIMSAVPNRMGIGVIGPALDKHGNSVGGLRLLETLSREWQLSIF
ncbi:MAG: glutaminase A [Bacillaceae bacterium]|nr:glutaminase A [Bacillaceae bacterium]